MQKKIRVLIVEPNKLPREEVIQNTLLQKQQIVGGYIEDVYLPEDDSVVLICNEESKLDGLEYNRDIGYDIIAGPFIIAKDNADTGEYESLDDNQIKKYQDRFNEKSIVNTKNKLEKLIKEKIEKVL